jgi:hypothetical protein
MREVKLQSVADNANSKVLVPYYPPAKTEEGFTDSQKRFTEAFNTMRKRLLDIGEMHKK